MSNFNDKNEYDKMEDVDRKVDLGYELFKTSCQLRKTTEELREANYKLYKHEVNKDKRARVKSVARGAFIGICLVASMVLGCVAAKAQAPPTSPLAGKCYAAEGYGAIIYYFNPDGTVEYDSVRLLSGKQKAIKPPYKEFVGTYRHDGGNTHLEFEWKSWGKIRRASHGFGNFNGLTALDNSYDMKECDCVQH